MHTETKKSITYLILYGLTTSFYMNRILTRYIFENANKYSWLIILGIALLILILSPCLYHLFSNLQLKNIHFKESSSKIEKVLLYIYLMLSAFICLMFLMTLINASWLVETRYIFILLPFLAVLYYVLNKKQDVFLRLSSLFFFPIIIQYLIFVFAKNKSMDLYALLPFQTTIEKSYIIGLIGLQMILTPFLGLFYMDEAKQPYSKKQFYVTIFMILFSLIFDAIVVSAQFGTTLGNFPFVYYESWCMISFGQYLGYLDIFAFFYWISSAFCFTGLCLYLIKNNYSKKKYQVAYPLLFVLLMFVLTHGSFYHIIKPFLLITSSVVLFILIFSYLRKVV